MSIGISPTILKTRKISFDDNNIAPGLSILGNGSLICVAGGFWKSAKTHIFKNSGKWECEFLVIYGNTSTPTIVIGVGNETATINNYVGADTNGIGYYANNGYVYPAVTGPTATFSTGDRFRVRLDHTANNVLFYKNDTLQQTIALGALSGTPLYLMVSIYGVGECVQINGGENNNFTPASTYSTFVDKCVFNYDPSNKKSFVGRPTTNLISPNGNNFTAWGSNAVTVTANASISSDGTKNASLLYVTSTGGSRSVSYIAGTPAGGSFVLQLKAANSSNCSYGIYTVSAWAGGGTGAIVSGPGSISGSGSLYTVSGLSSSEWTTVYVQSTLAGNLFVYPGSTGNTTGNSVYVCFSQSEALPYPTPYTFASRSVTQSIVDLSAVTSPDVTNLGWDSTNQPIFSGGSTYYFTCGASTSLDFGSNNFNVSQWIKTSDSSASDYMGSLSKYNIGTAKGMFIQYTLTNRYVVFGWDGSTFTTSTTSINNNVWRYISCQRTGPTTVEIYVDGALVQTGAGASGSSDSAQNLEIGRINVAGRYFNGSIGQTTIFNRSLTAKEIYSNFIALRGRYGV